MKLQDLDFYQTLKIKKDIVNSLIAAGFDINKGYLRTAVDRIFSLCVNGSFIEDDNYSEEIDASFVPEYLKEYFKKGLTYSSIDPLEIMYFKDILFGNVTYEELMQMQQQLQQLMQMQGGEQMQQGSQSQQEE